MPVRLPLLDLQRSHPIEIGITSSQRYTILESRCRNPEIIVWHQQAPGFEIVFDAPIELGGRGVATQDGHAGTWMPNVDFQLIVLYFIYVAAEAYPLPQVSQ